MKHPEEQYVTLHASVLRKAISDICENIMIRGWTERDVERAIRGLFGVARSNGGTINDLEEFTNLVVSKHGTPPGATTH
jgi:hypothetical protein